MKNNIIGLLFVASLMLFGCQSDQHKEKNNSKDTLGKAEKPEEKAKPDYSKAIPADNKTILNRTEVPILCYHQIRARKPSDSPRSDNDIISPENFILHIQMLADSGFHTIQPDDLYNHLVYGGPLPPKPVMITFDDGHLSQMTIGDSTLKAHGFKGVYFINSSFIGTNAKKTHHLTKIMLKQLSDDGNTIANHTHTHKNMAFYKEDDWNKEVLVCNQKLEKMIGKKVAYFAYPFGIYKREAFTRLHDMGLKAAFILGTKQSEEAPLYTIRRIVDPGHYTAKNLNQSMTKSFNKRIRKAKQDSLKLVARKNKLSAESTLKKSIKKTDTTVKKIYKKIDTGKKIWIKPKPMALKKPVEIKKAIEIKKPKPIEIKKPKPVEVKPDSLIIHVDTTHHMR